MSNKQTAIGTTYWSILGNVLLALCKFVAGYFGNSYALIADAIESAGDVFSSFLVLLGLKYSSRPADENHPYGHGKAEALVTFAVVGFLVVSATVIAYESIEHIRTPHKVPETFTLYVLAAIVVIKEVFYRFVSKKSDETNSSSLKADAWHHRSDAITSALAFIGISIAIFMGPGYETADDWAALLASSVIVYNAWLIFRPALGEILDEHLYDDMIVRIRQIAATVKGVIDTEKCHVRKTGMTYFVDLHLTVNGQITVAEGHDIAHRVKDALQLEIPEIADVLIHIEPDDL
ncbi:cation diffusion facilitator family transporter [Flavobacterium caeni]|uniref:Cation diffusion facilitator family transporter n=1 Tax=Flavobacterium caeni TaxID=490189 RepID=A0A1G5DZ85_9FLAO|nr:cation diffusion facilitator family transporter [Flavobacterium caeni]SCY20052.1 cation diffusion facilitator family transporter [Flavobacterium caeni]